MPFSEDRAVLQEAAIPGISEHDGPDPSFIDTLSAAWRQENIIGSYFSSAQSSVPSAELNRVDPDYNVFDNLQGYEEFADRFEDVYNPRKAAAVKADIDRERKDRETLAASGLSGVALPMAVQLADPTILIPGGALVRSGRVGYSAARSAGSVAAGAALGVGVQESILQGTQELRTPAESALNIGGSVILGGMIGGVAGRFMSKAEWTRLSKGIEADLAEDVANPADVAETIVSRMQSAGAATVDQIDIEDLGVGGPRAAQAVARATEALQINPGVQTMFSPSVKVRETYAQLVDNPVYTRMNMDGRTTGPAVENLVKQYERGALASWIRSNRSLYRQAKGAGYQGTRTDFHEAVARAGRRGDIDPDGNPFVTKAAQEAREKIFDPLLERAIRNGQLPEDVQVTTAASYVTRMWNRQRLIGEEDRFREIAGDYFREQIARIPEADRPDFVSRADLDDYVEDVVTSVFNNLTGRGATENIPDWIVPITRGPLKERTFRIPDALVEDFLENDIELVLRRYARTMGAEVELHEKFGRADMRDQIDAIRKDYDELARKAKDTKERQRINQSRERDLLNLEAFRDMIRGTYRAAEEGSNWSRLTRAALAWNYMRLLGGVALTSTADTMRLLGVHGMRATMREAIPALASRLKAAKISRADARDLGAVTETILQTRLASLADLNDPYRYGTAFDRYMSNATNVFSRLTLLGYWNDAMKQVASVMTQNRMARNALDWTASGKRERAYMAYLGIDEDMAGRIAGQLKRHGIEERGVWGANVSKWDDERAARAWAAALNKDVDRTIVTKGVADTPLWTKTNWGKLITQFKSFMLASHQRVLIAGLQERPHRFAEQLLFGTAMGMMIAWLKMIERGDFDRAENLTENPGLWIADGMDRTGILSLPFEVSNTADKLSAAFGGRNIGLTAAASALAGDESAQGGVSRYASRTAAGAVGGPTVGILDDWANIAAGLTRVDFNRSQANAIIRQIPGATLPVIRPAIHFGAKPALHEAVQ